MLRFLALFALIATPSAQEWTRFHGPNGTGISHAKTIPTKLSDTDVNWRVELPGVGHSSPVLWGNRIFVTAVREQKLLTIGLDRETGKVRKREDGKVLKPVGWTAPELEQFLTKS